MIVNKNEGIVKNCGGGSVRVGVRRDREGLGMRVIREVSGREGGEGGDLGE